ncbi:MAG: hypothetical protein AB7K37_08290 [Cyclobacteriaceae bacterium]
MPGRKRTRTLEKHTRDTLAGLVKVRTPIYRTYKGMEYKATLVPKGFILFKGKRYNTPTSVAVQIVDRSTVNGWTFWRIKNSSGEWVSLKEYMSDRLR